MILAEVYWVRGFARSQKPSECMFFFWQQKRFCCCIYFGIYLWYLLQYLHVGHGICSLDVTFTFLSKYSFSFLHPREVIPPPGNNVCHCCYILRSTSRSRYSIPPPGNNVCLVLWCMFLLFLGKFFLSYWGGDTAVSPAGLPVEQVLGE